MHTARKNNTTLYRSNDSVDHFRLKFIIRETSKVMAAGGKRAEEPYEEELEIAWQEKKYGPADIAEFLKKKDSKPTDAQEVDSFRHMSMLEDRGQPLSDMLKPVMIYTYTDKYNSLAMETNPVRFTEDENSEPYLSVSIGHNTKSDISDREKKVSERFYRERPFKVMHICMATDVNVTALQNKPLFPNAHFTEHVLCSIKIFTDGLLEFTPDISRVVDEI
jgi:hypothetical protein